MVYFLDESGRQKLCDLLADGPTFPLVKATQALFHWFGAWVDIQGVLGDFPQDAWHVRGFPHEDVSVGAEEANERAFLFEGKHGTNAHHFALSAPEVYEDLFRAFSWLEGSGQCFGVGCFFSDLFSDVHELSGGDDCHGVIAALDLALIGVLEGGADRDDPTKA